MGKLSGNEAFHGVEQIGCEPEGILELFVAAQDIEPIQDQRPQAIDQENGRLPPQQRLDVYDLHFMIRELLLDLLVYFCVCEWPFVWPDKSNTFLIRHEKKSGPEELGTICRFEPLIQVHG
jgi:hypothetical protein